MAFFGHFWQKSLFLAIFGIFSPVATGLFWRILAKFGQILQKGLEIPDPGGPRAGVLHQPLAPGPRGSRAGRKSGILTPPGPGGGFGPPGGPAGPSGTLGTPDPRREPRGPGARGWCKTPLARGSGGTPGPRDRGSWSPGPWEPLGAALLAGGRGPEDPSGIRDRVPGPLLGSPGVPRPLGGAPEGLFYINPSRRGPAVPGVWRQSRPGALPPCRPVFEGTRVILQEGLLTSSRCFISQWPTCAIN